MTTLNLKTVRAKKPEAVSISGLTYSEAWTLIGGLSNPSKMPWYSWSISAFACNTGGKLREVKGSICEKCYATRGFYQMPNVKEALDRRMVGLKDPAFVEAFTFVLTTLYERQRGEKENRFRWHDSGDLQDHEHLTRINEIAKRTPFLVHYLPTKEMKLVREWVKGNTIAPNLFIKVSHPMIGERFKAPPIKGISFSTAGVDDDETLVQCPAAQQGNKCLKCRSCWTAANINYHVH